VALIDEVELHLHPSWQQTVLPTLMEIFPNTQFIVTTHSPQVLTSIPARHIHILSDGKAYTVNEQTQGAEASRLLKDVFGVEPRPKELAIVRNLHDYAKLVYDEQWDTREAEELRQRLVEHYGPYDPKLMELDLHIENSKWERGL
jgi:predicted ATP-binding protein involved in virulence